MDNGIYQFKVYDSNNHLVSLSNYRDKVVLIVNIASKCGLKGQFEDLKYLQDLFDKDKFVILGFPSNQFANQEPGNNEEIQTVCETIFGVNFPVFAKIDVNGKTADPLYKFLTDKHNGFGGRIKWNFEKFLIDSNGNIVKRFSPITNPRKIEPYIKTLINV